MKSKKIIIKNDAVKFINSFGHKGKPMINKNNCPMKSNFELGIAEYDTTKFPTPKSHPDEEALFIYSGEGFIKIGIKIFPIKQGFAIYVPANTPHCIRKVGKKKLCAVYCHSGVIIKKQ